MNLRPNHMRSRLAKYTHYIYIHIYYANPYIITINNVAQYIRL